MAMVTEHLTSAKSMWSWQQWLWYWRSFGKTGLIIMIKIMITLISVLGRLVSRWSLAGSLDRQQGSGAQGGRGYHRYHCHWYYCDYWFAYKRQRSRCLRLSSSLEYSSQLLSWFKDYHIYWGVDGWDDYYPNYDDYDYDWSRLAMREVLRWVICSTAPGGSLRVTAAQGVSEVFSFRLKWALLDNMWGML